MKDGRVASDEGLEANEGLAARSSQPPEPSSAHLSSPSSPRPSGLPSPKLFCNCPGSSEIGELVDLPSSVAKGGNCSEELPQNEPQAYVELLEKAYRGTAELPGDFLDKRLKDFAEAFNGTSNGSVFFTSQPLRAALSKPIFQFLVLAFGSYFLFEAIDSTIDILGLSSSEYSQYNLVGLPDHPGLIHGAGLLKGPALIPGTQAPTFEQGGLSWTGVRDAVDGWYLIVSKSWRTHLDLHGLRFRRFRGQFEDWETVFTRWRWSETHPQNVWILHNSLEQCRTGTPMEVANDHEIVALNVQRNFTVVLGYIVADWMVALGFLFSAFSAAILKWTRVATQAVGYSFFAGMLCQVVAASVAVDSAETISQTGDAFSSGIHAFGILLFNQRYYIWCLFVGGAFTMGWGFLVDAGQIVGHLIMGSAQVLFFVGVMHFRRRALKQSRELIEPDQAKYHQVWENLTADAQEQDHLATLRSIVQKLQSVTAIGEVRQCTPLVEQEGSILDGAHADVHLIQRANSVSSLLKGPRDSPNPHITSLDQLYVQARMCERILRQKVVTWALQSNGLFPLAKDVDLESGGFVPATKSMGMMSDQMSYQVKWGGIKKPLRAVEKACRSYNGDCSRLLDLCRQNCCFKTVRDLCSCLEAIRDDVEVRVLRLKNRMDLDYNGASSAGYRDVAMNVKINTETTRKLGVQDHICEVQLILVCFAELKNDQGHRRYVKFRDERGE